MEKINQRFYLAVEKLISMTIISSKKDLANKLEMSTTGLSEILNGRNKLSTSISASFCKIYKINLYWLFYGEGSMFSDLTEIDETPIKEVEQPNFEQRLQKLETLLNVR